MLGGVGFFFSESLFEASVVRRGVSRLCLAPPPACVLCLSPTGELGAGVWSCANQFLVWAFKDAVDETDWGWTAVVPSLPHRLGFCFVYSLHLTILIAYTFIFQSYLHY